MLVFSSVQEEVKAFAERDRVGYADVFCFVADYPEVLESARCDLGENKKMIKLKAE